ncbi:MAG TPA: hypothetical protein VHW44_06205 [Pseudonocardiaceae bacterium]|jgi:hypothetical protein|nr:hypothetical protein [Pseudonocardiaceae bacterium]
MTDALRRVLRAVGGPAVADRLAALPGADLTTLLLAVSRRRAGALSAADVLRRYRTDRFVGPAALPFRRLRATEDALLSAVPPEFDVLTLAPVAPLGTHSVLGTVDQNNVISTVRASEVAADPTNGLALAAAARRADRLAEDARSAVSVRLATIQRVVRAQRFAADGRFAHFTLFALVSAGRDTGDLGFERQHAVEQLRLLVSALRANKISELDLAFTVLDPRFTVVVDAVRESLDGGSGVRVLDDPDRAGGRGYYQGLCFTLFGRFGERRVELGDGGFVDWTRALLGNRKERLLISGLGVDGVATAADR